MAVGRFQVMATLQAVRAFLLGKTEDSAKSFGLNRAIFYAAAKKGFKHKAGAPAPREFVIKGKALVPDKLKKIRESFRIETIGDEMAYAVKLGQKTLYTIGRDVQTPEDFERQIERRFEGTFEQAWNEAVKILEKYDRAVLLSQRYFYETIYKPRRDVLAARWTDMSKGKPAAESAVLA
jgi:hypothetical protein